MSARSRRRGSLDRLQSPVKRYKRITIDRLARVPTPASEVRATILAPLTLQAETNALPAIPMEDNNMVADDVQPPYPLYSVEVAKAELVTPRLKRLTIGVSDVPGLKADLPGQWLKVFVRDTDGRRHAGRPYTIRRLSADGVADVDFVLHGDDGRISAWAARATVGDRFEVSAPQSRSGFRVDPGVRHYLLLADETGLPAVAAILEVLPPNVQATVLVEVANRAEQQTLQTNARLALTWLCRDELGGKRLSEAVRSVALPAQCAVFAASESSEIKAIRAWIKTQQDISVLHASGYWKQGEADHRDNEAD